MKDEQFLDQILERAYETGSFNSLNLIEQAKYVCIWGTGTMFYGLYERYFIKTGIQVDYLCDNDPKKWGKEYLGIPCISPQKLENLEDVIVIPLVEDSLAVEKQIRQMEKIAVSQLRMGWDVIRALPKSKEWFENQIPKIQEAYSCLQDERSKEVFVHVLCNRITPELSEKGYDELYDSGEYFGPNVTGFSLGNEEVFCDAGAFIGDTVQRFVESTGGKFKEIHAFELDPDNYRQCCELVSSMKKDIREKILCYPLGIGNCEEEVFAGGSQEGISVLKAENLSLEDGKKRIAKIVRLDRCLKKRGVTLLKMDIEGMELQALKGAEGLLKMVNPPKLAICVYHCLDDLWNIPLYIKSIAPEYTLAMRHHAKDQFWETVCYGFTTE